MIFPPEGYVEEVARICKRAGVLLILDEVICGFGRTGKKFGYQHHDIKPDIVTMAKGITSGYLPLGATAVRRELFESFVETPGYERLRHISTFGGNPSACALALRNMELIEEEGLAERSARMGKKMRERLSSLEDHPNVAEIRGKGLLFGIELVADKNTRQAVEKRTAIEVVEACKSSGVLIASNFDTVPGLNNILTICPPLNTAEEDLELISRVVTESIEKVFRKFRPERV